MKKRFKLIVVVLVVFMLLTGCGARMIRESDIKNQGTGVSMFVILETGECYTVVYHKKTKVMYVISRGAYNCGTFTVMYDADGKPLLYKEDE